MIPSPNQRLRRRLHHAVSPIVPERGELLAILRDIGAEGITAPALVARARAVGLTLSEETILRIARDLARSNLVSIKGIPARLAITDQGAAIVS